MNIRTTSSLNDVTYVSNSAVRAIMKIDYEKAGYFSEKKDLEQNLPTYEIALNTWCNLCVDLGQKGLAEYILARALKHGLFNTISWATGLVSKFRKTGELGSYSQVFTFSEYSVNEVKIINQCLDYLKRFSVDGATGLVNSTINAVLQDDAKMKFRPLPWNYVNPEHVLRQPQIGQHFGYVESRTNMYKGGKQVAAFCNTKMSITFERPGETSHFDPYIREALLQLVPNELHDPGMYTDGKEFGPGAVSDACTCKLCKTLCIERHYSHLSMAGKAYQPQPVIELTTVYKTYKSLRAISLHPVQNQRNAYAYSAQMREWHRTHSVNVGPYVYKQDDIILLDPDNTKEERNGKVHYHNPAHQVLCDPRYCTIDQSNASNNVTKFHLRQYWPQKTARTLLRNAPSAFKKAKSQTSGSYTYVRMNMYAPMGAADCFDVESNMFAAIVIAAYNIYYTYNSESEELAPPTVFGDDCNVDGRVYDLCMELFRVYGFEPNPDKSFGPDDVYKESCGRHFWNQEEVTPIYFPRRPLNTTTTWYDGFKDGYSSTASSLISLNNALLSLRDGHRLLYGYTLAYMQLYIKKHWSNATFVDPDWPGASNEMLLGWDVSYTGLDLITGEIREWDSMLEAPPQVRFQTTVAATKSWQSKLSPIVKGSTHTAKHCLHTTIFQKYKKDFVVEELLYEEYLHKGPMYQDRRMEDLGVSEKRQRKLFTETPVYDFKNRWS